MDDEERRQDAAARARERRDVAPGASPLFISQSVSVLAFIHEKAGFSIQDHLGEAVVASGDHREAST